jgi:thioredoxin 1
MKGSFKTLIRSETPVLIDFYADWCAPCKVLTPILKDVKEALGDRIKILKIDVDSHSGIAGQYQIRGVPTMILFKQGEVLWRKSGVLPKDAILSELEPFL